MWDKKSEAEKKVFPLPVEAQLGSRFYLLGLVNKEKYLKSLSIIEDIKYF